MSTKKQQEIVKAATQRVLETSPAATSEPLASTIPDHAHYFTEALQRGYRLTFIDVDPASGSVAIQMENSDPAYAESRFIRDVATVEQFEALLPVLKDEMLRLLRESSPAVDIDEAPYDGPTVYSWLIPGERGYQLEIRVPCQSGGGHTLTVPTNVDLDTARVKALECRVGAEGDDEGRGLSEVERVYVMSVEPAVVRDTVDVTLDHQRALEANARLSHENEAFATAKETFAELGIDPERPVEYFERVNEQANNRMQAADAELASRRDRLCGELLRAVAHLREVAVLTGFAPIEPPAPAEPDYSELTIVVDYVDEVKHHYPRLAAATWVERMPGAEMSDGARAGYALLTGRIREFFRMNFGAGETEMANFDEFLTYIGVEIGKP